MVKEPTPIQELIDSKILVINDGYRAKNSELTKHGVPFARAGNINNGFKFKTADRFPIENLNRIGLKLSQIGDVVFTSKGTVGRFALVSEDTPKFVYSPQLCFWRSLDHSTLNPRWLFYWMQGKEFYGQFKGVSAQSDMAEYVNLRDQRKMEITLPSEAEQKQIAHILGTLDDKIELNRRMNRTLEEMAQAIFKSWFVDFDPVRAKAEAKAAGHGKEAIERAAMAVIAGKSIDTLDSLPAETLQSLAHKASLFPDSFQPSELGEIPAGWSVSTIGEETEIVGGGTPSTKNQEFWQEGKYHWVTPKDFSSIQDKVLLSSSRRITEKGLSRISSRLLPIGTVLMSSRAPVGYLAITKIETAINQGFIAMKSSGRLPSEYVLLWADFTMEDIKQASSGSTFAEISKKTFRPFSIIVPTKGPLEQFEHQVFLIFEKITSNVVQSRTLAELRDTLLPKLLSGELSVADAQMQTDKVEI